MGCSRASKEGGGKNKAKEINKKEGNILENGMKCTSCIIFFVQVELTGQVGDYLSTTQKDSPKKKKRRVDRPERQNRRIKYDECEKPKKKKKKHQSDKQDKKVSLYQIQKNKVHKNNYIYVWTVYHSFFY